MADPAPRPLLPHVTQPLISSSTNPERREQQRSYVFVDEQNRHRRLKVVRACEGCRKRKIKCDSANTNTWPCSACSRLKMQCIPPSSQNEGDDTTDQDTSGSQRELSNHYAPERYGDATQYSYQTASQYSAPYPYSSPLVGQGHIQHYLPARNPPPIPTSTALSPSHNAPRYNSVDSNVLGEAAGQSSRDPQNYTFATAPISTEEVDLKSEEHMIENFVGLNITNDAVAKYIVEPSKDGAGAFIGPEDDFALPQHIGSNARIPPEWMPSDSQAMQYFEYFFQHIHPYVPVINPPNLYRLWEIDKQAINPLVLEAIFACSALAMQHTAEGNKWLALAARHEERYKDSPRLSTLQGMLILLKAREAVLKRGYYYRSWMTIVNLVAMAKDLELDQHYDLHMDQLGGECDASSLDECAVKTRVWHVLFAVELIVGGPQGRTNYGVAIDTVDFDNLLPLPGLGDNELRISQHFTQFLRCVRNVRTSNLLYAKLRKRKADWAFDPEFVRHNADFDSWFAMLPSHMHISLPPGGAAPWINFHFVANLHAYHNLSILVHYRPQLELASRTVSNNWKLLMMQCLTAAKNICRLQEGILNHYGLGGLLHMLRGINFHIYAILTSVNIHLVALTSPDPEVNQEAPDYFTRHMRLLENCSSSWPMAELQAQIESLRQAFSADLTKPFELKASYVYGSPKRSESLSPSPNDSYLPHEHDHSTIPAGYNAYSIASPSASEPVTRADYGTNQPVMMIGTSQAHYDPSSQAQRAMQWDPSRIFDQWHAAFGVPQIAQVAQTPPSQPAPSPARSYNSHHQQDNNYANFSQPVPDMSGFVAQVQNHQPQVSTLPAAYAPPQHAYITPNMWREAVATASSSGIKRRWHTGVPGPSSAISKRPR